MSTAATVPSWMTAEYAAPGILPAEQLRDDAQVRGGADGEELGESLNQAEDDGFDETHKERARM